MDSNELLFLLKVLTGQFQRYLEMIAELNKLPPPKPLPATWDAILKEPDSPPKG